MPCTLRYGQAANLTLPLKPEQAAGFFVRESPALLDVGKAVREALREPLEYPPFAQAVVAGDRVTLAVDRLVPHGVEAAGAIVDYFADCGIAIDSLTVLFAEPRAAELFSRRAASPASSTGSPAFADKVLIEVHDPGDRGKLCYLTNTPSGRPVYLNRAVGESDLVVALGAARGANSWGFRGPYGGIYPTFSDRETHTRFRNAALLHASQATFIKSQEEIESIGWRSGTQALVAVVPGDGDDAAAVVAGEMGAAARQAGALFEARHGYRVAQTAKTAIVALSGSTAQTWNAFATALGQVLPAMDDGGVVAFCTELAEPLGPAMELLSRCDDDRDAALAHLRKDRPIDLFAALQLAEAQHRVRIHLLSKLDANTVESLGMSPVADPTDLGRLASRSEACIVVGDGQYATLHVG